MLLTLLVAASAVAQVAEPTHVDVVEGARIVAIRVVRHNVFDVDKPETSAWPYRAANALHIVSRERFIRSLLLFKEGDPLDPALLAESERLLRATGFLNPVSVTAHPTQGGVEVVVETFDQWTLAVDVSFGVHGSRRRSGLVLEDSNFLGLGKGLLVDWRRDQERNSVTLGYEDSVFLGTRWRLAFKHVEASDGEGDEFRLEYPFFALSTPYAGGGRFKHETRTSWLYAGGKKQVSGRTSRTAARVWGGVRLPSSEGTHDRLIVAYFHERVSYDEWSWVAGGAFEPPPGRDLSGLELGWERQADRFVVAQGFRSWQRQEDLGLGPNWSAGVGLSLPELGGDRPRVLLRGSGSAGFLRGQLYTSLEGRFAGRVEKGRLHDGVLGLEGVVATIGERGWRGRVAADLGVRLERDRQLTLGADTGLRGWDPDTFDGTSRAVANLEWRARLTDEVLHVAILGVTVFADAGYSWGARIGRSTGRIRGDVGVGLLAEITRSARVKVVRIELAKPDDGGKPLFLITGQALF